MEGKHKRTDLERGRKPIFEVLSFLKKNRISDSIEVTNVIVDSVVSMRYFYLTNLLTYLLSNPT